MADWQLPGYIEVDTLGIGGFGRVVLARHQASGTLVAIKYLHQRHLADRPILDGFRREAAMLATVPSPHVVRLYDFVLAPEGAALVMEAVPGVSLRAILAAAVFPPTTPSPRAPGGALAPESALAVLKGSLLGLAAAHALGVVHRDYKPDNVLVSDRGESKLVDFGLAVLDGQHGLAAGSPAYMAPEQWAGHPGTPATDVYAATCVFYQCVTGRRPYSAATSAEFKALHEQAPVPLDAVPAQLRGLVARGLAKHPGQRPATAEVFVTELQAAATTAYGHDWEQRGWQRLAPAAAALLAATPLAVLVGTAAAPIGGVAVGGAGAGATGVATGAASTATAAGATGVGVGAAGTGAAAGSAGVGASAAAGGLFAGATAKVAAAAAVVVLGAGGVVAYNAIASDEDPAPVAQVEPLYAYSAEGAIGVVDGTKVVGEIRVEDAATVPEFTADGRFAFSWNVQGSILAMDTRTGGQQQIPCGGCTTVAPVGGSEVAWFNDGAEQGLVIADLGKQGAVRTVDIEQVEQPPSDFEFGPPGLLAGGGGSVVIGFPGGATGYQGKYLYLVDTDDGQARRVQTDQDTVNQFAFSKDGRQLAFTGGFRTEACSGDVQAFVVDVATAKATAQPKVEAAEPRPNEGRGLSDIWWAGDQLYGSYERTMCNTGGSTDSAVPPSVWRLSASKWEKVAGFPQWRSLGAGRAAFLEGVNPDDGTGALYVEVKGKRTKIRDGVRAVVTPPQ